MNKEELVEAIKAGVAADLDLRGADLQGADLTNVDLSGANLFEANLRKSNLEGANLSQAYIEVADLPDELRIIQPWVGGPHHSAATVWTWKGALRICQVCIDARDFSDYVFQLELERDDGWSQSQINYAIKAIKDAIHYVTKGDMVSQATVHELTITSVSRQAVDLALQCAPRDPGCEFCEWWGDHGTHEGVVDWLVGSGPWRVVPVWEQYQVVLIEADEGEE